MTTSDVTQELLDAQAQPKTPPGRIFRKVIWLIALLLIGALAVTGEIDLQMAESAPQQAAAAGVSCMRLIAVYTFARAIDGLWK